MTKLLPGLLQASYRGLAFFVPDTSSDVGRRVAVQYFPGIDLAAYDDFGIMPQNISIEGLYVGDDYIAFAKKLKSAFERAGTGTLIHPWLGNMNVILLEPATINFSSTELRVVRFSARFEQVLSQGLLTQIINSLAPNFLSTCLSLANFAVDIIDAVDELTISRLKSDATSRVANQYFALIDTIQGEIGAKLQNSLPENTPTNAYNFATNFQNISSTLYDATIKPAKKSAVAPAKNATIKQPLISNKQAVNISITLCQQSLNLMANAPSKTDAALYAAFMADILGKILACLVDIELQSRKEALNLRSTLNALLNGFSNQLQSMDNSQYAGIVSQLYKYLRDVNMLQIGLLNEIIGRLPQTTIINLPQDSDAFLLAYALYGDDLNQVEAMAQDIINRNNLAHPAAILSGDLEILVK